MLIEALMHAPMGFLIGTLGTQELLVILLIAVIIFGGRKIPEIFKGFGEGIREFKRSMKDEEKPAEKPEEKREEVKTHQD